MPVCKTMILSLESPRSPVIGPPSLGILPLKWWRAVIGSRICTIDDANHGCHLSGSTLSFTVACGMEVVGVKPSVGAIAWWATTCIHCWGLTPSLVITLLLSFCLFVDVGGLFIYTFSSVSVLHLSSHLFCTLQSCQRQSCIWCYAPSIIGLPASVGVNSGRDYSSPSPGVPSKKLIKFICWSK